jgi:methyl-accepting chemotaxis protein
MLMLIMAGALLVGIAVNFALNRVLRRSFLRVAQALEDVAGGDLLFTEGSARVSFTEFRSLMKTLGEKIIPRLRDTIAHIESGTAQSSTMSQALEFNIIQTISSLDRVGNSSRSISAESFQLNRLMDEAEQSSASIKGSVQSLEEQISEQSASLTQITASIEEMSASLQSVAHVAGEKLKSAADLNDRSLQGLSQVENTQSLIQQVNDDSLSIIEFLDIINDISERISLLAMNAAIEAAHAGEAGRGFAIVSGEMRSLAESTAENGRKIKETLDHTMANMSLANRQGMSTTDLIRSVNDELGSFINAFQEIVASTSEISAGRVQLLEGAGSLQESTALTLAESSSINGEAGQLGYSIEETKKSSERNVSVTEDLQVLLSGLNDCQSEMMALGNYNSDISKSLMEKMKTFRYEKEDGETLIIDMIRSHQDWEDRIYWHLAGKTPLTVDQIVDHHDCALGRWLDAHQDGDNGENFRALLMEHESFHDCMKSIILDGEQGTEGAGFARLMDLSHQVIRRLLALLGYEYGDDSAAESEVPVLSQEL